MRAAMTSAIVAALVGGGAAITAAPGQTLRPGDMTRAEVWVQNDASQPIPVRVKQTRDEPPVRVFIANGENPGAPPMRVRVNGSIWEYRSVTIKAADDPANALAALGAEGWEVTGLQWAAPDGTRLLLKRAR